MTELEALAKDCIENHTHRLIDKPSKQDIYTREESIYISGYNECERQNKNKIAELEAQIEKMKCDVKQEQSYWNSGEMQYDLYQRLLDKWEIKEK